MLSHHTILKTTESKTKLAVAAGKAQNIHSTGALDV